MPTGNFDEPVGSPAQPDDSGRSLRLPADYYSAPLSEVKPIFPRWVPWGCGAAATLFLLVLFAGGFLLTGPRLGAAIDLVLGMTLGEMKGMVAPEVTEAQKAAFDAEVEAMREKLRESNLSAQEMQPFLRAMQKAIADRKVTPVEIEHLTGIAREAREPKAASGSR